MSLVCLDTHYFRWGIFHSAEIGQEDCIPQAQAFFEHLDGIDATIIVPSVVVMELLMKSDPLEHHRILTTMEARFHVVEFDLSCANAAAQIWKNRKAAGVIDRLRGVENWKTEIKVDTQILGTAISQGADILYTEDAKFKSLATGLIVVKEMEKISLQENFLATLDDSSTASPPPSLQSPTAPRRRAIEREQLPPLDPQDVLVRRRRGFSIVKEPASEEE